MVLIELKRDRDALVGRKEAFEFQAIRYAANYASIKTTQDLVQILYAPYIERHQDEYDLQQLTSVELATRLLDEFLSQNQAERTFNQRQRIALISFGFDLQTLSACAWLAKNGIDVQCISLTLIRYQSQHFFFREQIIPPQILEDFFIGVSKTDGASSRKIGFTGSRKLLPKLDKMFAWKLISRDDKVHIRGHNDDEASAVLVDDKTVICDGKELSYNQWGRNVTKWPSINIYESTIHDKTGKTLDQLRREKMDEPLTNDGSESEGA